MDSLPSKSSRNGKEMNKMSIFTKPTKIAQTTTHGIEANINSAYKPDLHIEIIIESDDEERPNLDWSVPSQTNEGIHKINAPDDIGKKHNDTNENYTLNQTKQALKNYKSANKTNVMKEKSIPEELFLCNEGSQDFNIKIEFLDEEQCDDNHDNSVYLKLKQEEIEIEEHEIFQCSYCCSIFTEKSKLFFHMEQEHPQVLYQCNICSASFSNKDTMTEHIRAFHGQLKPAYNSDRKVLQACELLKDLEVKHHGNFTQNNTEKSLLLKPTEGNSNDGLSSNFHVYKCQVCQHFFGCAKDLYRDVKFTCKTCGEKINPEKSICKICGKLLNRKTLKGHMTEVHGNGQFQCLLCGIVFKCQRYLHKHTRYVHNGFTRVNKIKKCKICGKVFNNADCLGQHIKNCHDYKVECSICHSHLKSKAYLRSHINRVHYNVNDGKMYKCGTCLKEFKCPTYLNIHKRYNHSEELQKCPKCFKSFCTENYFNRHVLKCKLSKQ